jgi:hypothetical protein
MARACGCALLFDIVNVQKLDARSCNRLRLDRRMLSGSAVYLSIWLHSLGGMLSVRAEGEALSLILAASVNCP